MSSMQQSTVLPSPVAATLFAGELSGRRLLDALAMHAGKRLVFAYDGHDCLPGYHVTEVKSATIDALDCGANGESWRETVIQLWDVAGDGGEQFMPVGKFLAIMQKAAARLPLDGDARLNFEVSDGIRAVQLYRAESVQVDGDIVRVALAQRPATCKPRDRWWLEQKEVPASSCGKASASTACCGA